MICLYSESRFIYSAEQECMVTPFFWYLNWGVQVF